MEIFNYFDSDNKAEWTEKIKACDWAAAKFLSELLEQDTFFEKLVSGCLYIMENDGEIVSFLTLTTQDCIADMSLFPWIGFVYTAPEYRGNRYSEKLIAYACERAADDGAESVYIGTDHIGLYEKFGFEYMESRIDVFGDDCRIYTKKLTS